MTCACDAINKPKVIVLLVNHKDRDCKKAITNIFKAISNPEKDALLYEDPNDGDIANFKKKICWERIDLVDRFEREAKRFDRLYSAALNFGSLTNRKEMNAVKEMFLLAEKSKIPRCDLKMEDLEEHLKDRIKYGRQQQKDSWELVSLVRELFARFKNDFVKSTFHERQTSLIDNIGKLLNFKKIFVICGAHHADPQKSPFPDEVERLLSFIWEKGADFRIFDTEDLYNNLWLKVEQNRDAIPRL